MTQIQTDRPAYDVVSYVRRGSRMTASQRGWLERHADRWLIPFLAGPRTRSVAAQPPLDLQAVFGRRGDLVVEIGCGQGEALTAAAQLHPGTDFLGFEVFEPALAVSLGRIAAAGLTNVRLVAADAIGGLEHLIAPGALSQLWVFFPDPWPKARHHKRRLVSPAFAALAADRLGRGGWLRLATDWPDYAAAMTEALSARDDLTAVPAGRFAERPLTKFERRALEQGRTVQDLTYRRTDPSGAAASPIPITRSESAPPQAGSRPPDHSPAPATPDESEPQS
ncbi:MAG: tRNA (guanosine(46)-N7)-methyltransferase TrmB [Propionibacteriaceae bacterium]|jgi:tRNA (guanine-N7-)-methyltransferase|nr:tRNA (guanosine(46)-N7)-methyltransferase TrmB [Propionibacteriaceae bacterium]